MKIQIVGYTNNPEKGYLPEAISAGFARVSRRKEPISFLVEEAKGDLDKARKSNTTIVYGYGHSSIAEHIVFNLVFENVSRLMSAKIMEHRLVSYIEKSQRYIEIDSGYVVPKEIAESKYNDRFRETADEMYRAYDSVYRKLAEYVKRKHQEWKEVDVQNRAKEDARFILPTATYTQFGMTINSRNYEYMIMRLKSQSLSEGHAVAEKLLEEGVRIAPSLIKYTKANPHFQSYKDIKKIKISGGRRKGVSLLHFDKEGDDRIVAALLHSTHTATYNEIQTQVSRMSKSEKEQIINKALKNISVYDPVLREFEYLNYLFEIEMSECCYHQFLRHRMNTQTIQQYTTELGYVVPSIIKEANLEREFKEAVERGMKLFDEIKKELPNEAPYILPNAVKRRVLVGMNARELYHFSRIRAEEYAQWEIRDVTNKMLDLAKKVTPLTLKLAMGRSEFSRR